MLINLYSIITKFPSIDNDTYKFQLIILNTTDKLGEYPV